MKGINKGSLIKSIGYFMGVVYVVTTMQMPVYAYELVKRVTITATAICGKWPDNPMEVQFRWRDVPSNPNSPKRVDVPLRMSPIAGDVVPGSGLEVVTAGYDEERGLSKIYLWNFRGEMVNNWHQEIGEAVISAIGLGDLNNDRYLEIIVPGSSREERIFSKLYIYNYAGNQLPGWPKVIDRRFLGPPVIADIDEDDVPEIFVLAHDNDGANPQIFGWRANGSILPGWPVDLDVSVVSNIISVADIDIDGEYEVVATGRNKVFVFHENGTPYPRWPVTIERASRIGAVVLGDVNNDRDLEIIAPVTDNEGNSYVYCWDYDGNLVWSVAFAGSYGSGYGAEDYVSLGDLDNDGYLEVVSTSVNGYVGCWRYDGSVMDGNWPVYIPPDGDIPVCLYKPIIANIDDDDDEDDNTDIEIIATSNRGKVYVWNEDGTLLEPWPYEISGNPDLSAGCFITDIDGPAGYNPDIELLFGSADRHIYVMGTGGYFDPNTSLWIGPRYNFKNTGTYVADNNTLGWSVFDNQPEGATIKSNYDWQRGSRIIGLKGNGGLSNGYRLRNPDGTNWDSKRVNIRWAMRYSYYYIIYISVDTLQGHRYLYYTPSDSDDLGGPEDVYIHHGLNPDFLGDDLWHIFQRNLAQDIKDAQPTNEIVDVNAFFIRGNGYIDDVTLLPPEATAELPNLALDATVSASSELPGYPASNVIDGQIDAEHEWRASADDERPWIKLTWPSPVTVNKVVLYDRVSQDVQVLSGRLWFSDGTYIDVGELPDDGTGLSVVFSSRQVSWIKFEIISWRGNNPGLSEFRVYYDPNLPYELPRDEEFSAETYIKIENGFFWNPMLNEGLGGVWVPHGIAYQTWIPELGLWQTFTEIRETLDEMELIGVNSLRVDFAWKYIETEDDAFDWERYDFLLEQARVHGMKVFPLIGYQWPPEWFPDEWYTVHPPDEEHPDFWRSDVITYENQDVRDEFCEFLQAVVERYSIGGIREDLADTMCGWILGNEYGYLGLWSNKYDGYDEACIIAFRKWLKDKYSDDIQSLNAVWATDNNGTPPDHPYLPNYPYESFDEVDMPDMPTPYGEFYETSNWKYCARNKASWYDLIQWREESIAGFIAMAASAVRVVDEEHLITYSAVGMQWGEEDLRYHAEDARKIMRACEDAGAPLSFWSINNYPWGLKNNELMTGQWGIARARHDTGLPVMLTETGFTSTETMYPGIDEERQAKLLRNAVWEALESGAMGVHLFTWKDRPGVGYPREVGFGVVRVNPSPPPPFIFKPAYYAVRMAYLLMDQLGFTVYDESNNSVEYNLAGFLANSQDPPPDIAFLWDDATDSIVNRYEAEMNQLFGTLERLGFEPYFVNDEELLRGDYLDYDAIILPRNQKMFEETFGLLNEISLRGTKIHANADLPGLMTEHSVARHTPQGPDDYWDDWRLAINDIFGIDANNSRIDPNLEDEEYFHGYETPSSWIRWMPKGIVFPDIIFNAIINMWKYRDRLSATTGMVLATFHNGNPALVVKDNEAAISLFSLGDNKPIGNEPYSDWTWENRYDWMKVIYTDPVLGFGLTPRLNITGSKYVLIDYRLCPNDSLLLSFKNYSPDTNETVSVTADLIVNKTIKSVMSGNIIEENSDGTVSVSLEPDGHELLFVYAEPVQGTQDVNDDNPQDQNPDQPNQPATPDTSTGYTSTSTDFTKTATVSTSEGNPSMPGSAYEWPQQVQVPFGVVILSGNVAQTGGRYGKGDVDAGSTSEETGKEKSSSSKRTYRYEPTGSESKEEVIEKEFVEQIVYEEGSREEIYSSQKSSDFKHTDKYTPGTFKAEPKGKMSIKLPDQGFNSIIFNFINMIVGKCKLILSNWPGFLKEIVNKILRIIG